MFVPILKLGFCLIVTAQSDLTDTEWKQLQFTLLEKVASTHARNVILDMTGVNILDSFAGRMINDIAQMIHLGGAETIIVGIQPEVAWTLVQLGLRLKNVITLLDLEEGIELASRQGSANSLALFTKKANNAF
ncbi:MAG: STAS domain-containing protein [Bdellovibrionia bacterium]